MPVRSASLGHGTVAAAASTLVFTVPEDSTVLAKTLYAYGFHSATANLIMQLIPAEAGEVQPVYIPVAPGSQVTWEGWLALPPLCQFRLNWGGDSGMFYWLSGTVLPGFVAPLGSTKPA